VVSYPRIAAMRDVETFRRHIKSLGLPLEAEDRIETAPDSPLAKPINIDGFEAGNRWVIHPMEGWDAEADGSPSDLVRRRWRNFGLSGAKWIWGGEAMAVLPEARANPNQLLINEQTQDGLARLHEELLETHRKEFGTTDDLLVGFQLTHSGRFSKPFRKDRPEPQILYRHPILDRKFHLPQDYPLISDDEIRRIIEKFVAAGRIAEQCGAAFVDVKHCHGYLGHEFLSAYSRPGPYGGAFENRTRFLREIVQGIRGATSKLKIGVRLSAFDLLPYRPDPEKSEGARLGPGIPEDASGNMPYEYGFGVDPLNPAYYQLSETERFIELLKKLGIRMLNVTAGSPYYNPHIQRPALFPPSDGYQPPEDPLVGCARQIEATAALKHRFPEMAIVGTAYSYLQDFLPHVAQWAVRSGKTDTVGLGRMVLAYPTLPRDTLQKGTMESKRICRTFSDCTTGPRQGLVSGCFPLDPFYRKLPEAAIVKKVKASLR
jgi:2,4-dienoyl-CoA reductase-like NADH-dependent reductase (Old Yellow Enzyme family)